MSFGRPLSEKRRFQGSPKKLYCVNGAPPSRPNLLIHKFQRDMVWLTERHVLERLSFRFWGGVLYSFVETLMPREVEAGAHRCTALPKDLARGPVATGAARHAKLWICAPLLFVKTIDFLKAQQAVVACR